ncbi:N,N-dimethylformamidase beta subunit family domain-containing protein [Streptomyces sp. NPDC094448]|uniref:N,N-dimethylformamidase beta subunit family domain-containing protein n=1 Tax=Streptomyces sp. NPDC094448 TaxID=3366063 RepID=UPI00382A6860
MSRPPRRVVLSLLGIGAAAGGAGTGAVAYTLRETPLPKTARTAPAVPVMPAEPIAANGTPLRSIAEENRLPGSRGWLPDATVRRASDDRTGDIMGYAATTSAGHGEVVDFHISVARARTYRVAVYRIGHYGGRGARLMTTSPPLPGRRRTVPAPDPGTGTVACAWPVSWSVRIPDDWRSGLYQAVFTSDEGHRSSTPFVVREPQRASALLCVIPFTTYQAYNMWPKDRKSGKNLYGGYRPGGGAGGFEHRAVEVSFDRPYSGSGTPSWFNMDSSFARWAEENGHNITYASSIDLHDGTVDPARYPAVFFPGHDEYWSKPMYDAAARAVASGRNLAFLGANNVYFHIRLEQSAKGRPNRIMACYKTPDDPSPGTAGATVRWREIRADGALAEQRLLGIQFNGIVKKPAPLVVQSADHWLWHGTGVKNGERLPDMIGVEADAYNGNAPEPPGARRVLLAASRYTDSRPGSAPRTQNTAVTEQSGGGTVFMAGTFHWPLALVDDDRYTNTRLRLSPATRARIRRATANLTGRLTGGGGSPGTGPGSAVR